MTSENLNSNAKNNKYLIYMALTVILSVFSALSGDLLVSIIVAAVGGGFFASVCLDKLKGWRVGVMAILPPVLAFAFTQSPENTMLSLGFLPVGVVTLYCMKKGFTRSQLIVRGVASLALFYGAFFSLCIYRLFGSLSIDTAEKFIRLNIDVILFYMNEAKEIYTERGVDKEIIEKLFSKEVLDELVTALRVSWLGYGLALFGVASFSASAIAKFTLSEKDKKAFFDRVGKWRFVLSKIGACVFIIAYFASSLYSGEKEGLYLPFALNAICLSMMPGVLYMGVRRIFDVIHPTKKTTTLIFIIVAATVMGKFAMLFFMILGIYSSLIYKEKTETEKNEKKNN